jgi:hypothetical protein
VLGVAELGKELLQGVSVAVDVADEVVTQWLSPLRCYECAEMPA